LTPTQQPIIGPKASSKRLAPSNAPPEPRLAVLVVLPSAHSVQDFGDKTLPCGARVQIASPLDLGNLDPCRDATSLDLRLRRRPYQVLRPLTRQVGFD
jgi:hypothetical protein